MKTSLINALIVLLLISFPLAGCAKTGENSWEIGPSSIIKAFKQGKLVVDDDAPNAPDAMTMRPVKGQILLSGTLETAHHDCETGKLEIDTYGPVRGFGSEGQFSALIDEKTGEIVKARLAYVGQAIRAHELDGDLQDKLNGSYGFIGRKDFAISVYGPHWYYRPGHGEDRTVEPTNHFGAVVMGTGDLINAPNGATFKVKLYIGVDSIPRKPPSMKNCNEDVAFGDGILTVTR